MRSLSNESLNNSRSAQQMLSLSPSSSPQSPRTKRTRRKFIRRHFSLSTFLSNCSQSACEYIQRTIICRKIRHHPLFVRYIQPHIQPTLQAIQTILLFILSTIRQLTVYQILYLLLFILSMTAAHVYFIDMPKWEYEREWLDWEEGMQLSVAELIPPLPSSSSGHLLHRISGYDEVLSLRKEVKDDRMQYYSNNKMKGGNDAASEFVVPLPDYDIMANVRGELAKRLHGYAVDSCKEYKASLYQHSSQQQRQQQQHLLPVMGITVATDSPTNNYLRRLLYTVDFSAVGSIVITWYDEQTESQLAGKEGDRLSHTIILDALEEFIVQKKFVEIPWDASSQQQQQQQRRQSYDKVHLADVSSMKLMSKIATSVHQYCRYNNDNVQPNNGHNPSSSCQNELIILRFSTNLGCSSGVNNPLFLHPHAPHWLTVNYDIAYPPGILHSMGAALQKTLASKPDLAVHTFGYIYGRGKIENPWSNFVMTSCAVANVGVWDENIFPAYYEDDDFRDRIRYIMGKWIGVIGHDDGNAEMRNIPHKLMNDTHLIRYQTDRSVAVAHGPLSATTYLSGTHEALKEEPEEEERRGWFFATKKKKKVQQPKEDPYYYEKERWNIYKEVADGERYFRCKHGALPDPGEHGEDSLRYFGWHERFLQPFVNRTRLTKLKERVGGLQDPSSSDDPSTWSLWSFNATRRKCVHEATNKLLAMPPSKEKTEAILKLKESCSVC